MLCVWRLCVGAAALGWGWCVSAGVHGLVAVPGVVCVAVPVRCGGVKEFELSRIQLAGHLNNVR